MYHFQVKCDDCESIFIVRIKHGGLVCGIEDAKKEANKLMAKKFDGVTENDFRVEELTVGGLLSKLKYVDDIAQLMHVTV